LLIVPSARALPASSFATFTALATEGLHVYLSWFAGTGPGMKGAWWPPLQTLFGARHRLSFGLAEFAPEPLVLTVQTAFGTFQTGDKLTASPAGPPWGRAYLPLEVAADGVEVLLDNQDGVPMLLRRRLGRGAVYLGACPLEYWGSTRPNANVDDPVWQLYRALAEEAEAVGPISGHNPDVVVDTLERSDGETFVWLVNLSGRDQPNGLALPDGSRLVALRTGEPIAKDCGLGPFEVLVAKLVTSGAITTALAKPKEQPWHHASSSDSSGSSMPRQPLLPTSSA
jgi:hypothetical protein